MTCPRRARPPTRLAAALLAASVALAVPGVAVAQTAKPTAKPRPAASVPVPPSTAKPTPRAAPRAVPLPTPSPRRVARMPLDVPFPVPRPRELDAPAQEQAQGQGQGKEQPQFAPPPPAGEPPEEAPLPGADDAALAACLADFAERGGTVIPRVPEEPPPANPACAIPGPVTFAQVRLAEGAGVKLESAVTVRCTLARELASWIRDDLAPITRRHGGELAQVSGVGGHACRPRNGQPGAQISEHASGNAFDLLALKFADGRVVDLWKDDADTREIRAAVRESACARFFTVLGPGADSAHANHVHLDLRERRNGFRMCQWDVK